MFSTRLWLQRLHKHGFRIKRHNGGHARLSNGAYSIDIPIHQKELSRVVIASIKRVLRACQFKEIA